jgi:hypothetical protein
VWGVRRWLIVPLFVAVGLLVALPGGAAVQVDKAKVSIAVADGKYQLMVENTGDTTIASFTFVPASTLHVSSIASSTEGTCQMSGTGFSCSVMLGPPPCACRSGHSMSVFFTGYGESSGSSIQFNTVTVPATGGGAIAAPPTPPPTTTTPTTPPPPKATPKPKAKPPFCKKGQKSTKKKPCRKRPRKV